MAAPLPSPPPPPRPRPDSTASDAASSLLFVRPVAKRAMGMRVIIAYKLVKAFVWPALALFMGIGIRHGLVERVQAWIVSYAAHLTRAWSIQLAEFLFLEATREHILIITIALTLDGLVSAVEAWALIVGHAWGEWLVILSTAALLPFEIMHLIAHLSFGRFALLAVNLLVVYYLAHRVQKRIALHHRQAARAAR